MRGLEVRAVELLVRAVVVDARVELIEVVLAVVEDEKKVVLLVVLAVALVLVEEIWGSTVPL